MQIGKQGDAMRYVEEGTRFATLEQALENDTVDELKKLLAAVET